MPTLGAPELIIVLVIIILIFGVGKLPEVGQALGKGIREFRGAAEDSDDKPETPKVAAPVVEAPRPVAAVEAPQAYVQPVTTAPPTTVQHAAPVVTTPSTTPVAAPHVTSPVAPPQVAASAPATISYTVQTGDTLDLIAQRHGVSIEAVMAANGYSQRDRVLYAGDKMQVPTATTTA